MSTVRTHNRSFVRNRTMYLPTPEEIARECARIRASWTPHEHSLRFGYAVHRWLVPQGKSHLRQQDNAKVE